MHFNFSLARRQWTLHGLKATMKCLQLYHLGRSVVSWNSNLYAYHYWKSGASTKGQRSFSHTEKTLTVCLHSQVIF